MFDTQSLYYEEAFHHVYAAEFEGVTRFVVNGDPVAGLPTVGDVAVRLDGPPGEIRFALRRWTRAVSQEEAEHNWNEIGIWAFELDPPKATDFDTYRCEGPWESACVARVDGPADSGADMQVTLPRGWQGSIEIYHHGQPPHDSDESPRFPEIEVDGARDDVEVSVGAGSVRVELEVGATSEYVEVRGEDAVDIDLAIPKYLRAVADLSTSEPCGVDVDCAGFTECEVDQTTQESATALLNQSSNALITTEINLRTNCLPTLPEDPGVRLRALP